MNLKFKINFPIVKSYSSEYYALIILDSFGVTHYWNFNGNYDGCSSDPHIDYENGTCLN